MQQNDNISYWSACWKATTSAARDEPDERKVAESWNRQWDKLPERPERGIDDERMQRSADETIGFLEHTGLCIKGSAILDIGCGPGTLALPLARKGATVTALDISSRSLERVKEISDRESLLVKTKECSWWTADIDELGLRNNFDLVIASRTPAINDAESIERMMACSRNLCYYSSFLNIRENRMHQNIQRLIGRPENGDHDRMRRNFNAYTMIFPFMYLYFCGYTPLVRINRPGHESGTGREDPAEQAIRLFGRNQDLDDATKEKIRNYYRDVSKNGTDRMSPAGCHGMMVWKVKG